MKRRAAIAGFCLALSAVAAAAEETAEARAARFYAAGLEAPLLALRRGAMLIETCTQRLRRACTKEQRGLAAGSRTLTLLDALTLFPQRPAEDPVAGISRSRELAQKIEATSAAMQSSANGYDRLLFARFGATLRVCPGDDVTPFRESVDDLIRIDFTSFQALSGADLDRANAELAAEEAKVADELRRAPPEDCAAARKLGEYLMELMNAKLLRWNAAARREPEPEREFEFGTPPRKKAPPEPADLEVARAVAGNFVTVLATELQLTVYPDSAARIKSIADAVEKAASGQ
jgi:hypothetical protein